MNDLEWQLILYGVLVVNIPTQPNGLEKMLDLIPDPIETYRVEAEKLEVQFPHCDMFVCHAPGECVYCDQSPALQEYRVRSKINFTGVHLPELQTCPSELMRPLDTINRWHGNRPWTQEDIARADAEWEKMMQALEVNEGLVVGSGYEQSIGSEPALGKAPPPGLVPGGEFRQAISTPSAPSSPLRDTEGAELGSGAQSTAKPEEDP